MSRCHVGPRRRWRFFQSDIGPIRVAHQPVLTAEDPNIDSACVEHVDDAAGDT